MARDVARDTLYRAPINLWVEDRLTLEYLSRIWNDPGIAYFVGGGNDGVRALADDAADDGFSNVFGLTDRDFRPSNKSEWANPRKTFRTFVLPAHEIENYLLDAPALAACRFNNRGLTADEIEERIRSAAAGFCWWAACRDVLAELKRRFRDGFVPDPPRTLSDATAAKAHICKSPWFQKLAAESEKTDEAGIELLLKERHVEASNRLASGEWRIDFAGKEIFRDIGSRIFDRMKSPGYNPTPAAFDIDLAQEVADQQLKLKSIPQDLTDLHSALKARLERLISQASS